VKASLEDGVNARSAALLGHSRASASGAAVAEVNGKVSRG
jgi:hypothetical protein